MKPYYETDNGQLYNGDVLEVLGELPDGTVQCVITSPPYWGLRDYGVSGQLGLEETPEEYIDKMVAIFREVRRVMRDDGTLWLNMGDCYSSGGRDSYDPDRVSKTSGLTNMSAGIGRNTPNWAKPKDLLGIPWRLALALQSDGWYLRSDIIWAKPNPMPESVTDRPTKAHEYVFLMSKQARYYYDADAVREPNTQGGLKRFLQGAPRKRTDNRENTPYEYMQDDKISECNGRNKRTVWTIPTQPYSEAHFATFPTALVIPCIKAGTSEKGNCSVCGKPWVRVVETKRTFESGSGRSGNPIVGKQAPVQGAGYGDIRLGPTIKTKTVGWEPNCECTDEEGYPVNTEKPIVLDPFMGSGTVAEVCERYGRRWVGIELSKEYCDIAVKRIEKEAAQLKMEFTGEPPVELEPELL